MNASPTDPKLRKAIVKAYQRGDKIHDIEEALGVSRATIYYVLEKEGRTPNRIQRGRRLVGDDQQLAQLYDLITLQDERIQRLESQLRALGEEPTS